MPKFNVGDHIAANELSDEMYGITCHSNGWTGYVTVLDDDDEDYEEGDIGVVSEIRYNRGIRDAEYIVHEDYFDLIPDEELDAPNEDLFAVLFG